MKTFILSLAIMCCSTVKAQNLDTVYIRNLNLQSQDWAFLVGSYGPGADSAAIATYRKMRDRVQTVSPSSWTQTIVIDSIPGRIVLDFYRIVKSAPAGVIAARYIAITGAIESYSILNTWITAINSQATLNYTDRRSRGANLLLDN